MQKNKQNNQYFLHVSKNLMHLRPELVYRPNPFISSKYIKNLGFSISNKNYNNEILATAFQDLLCIKPDVFEKLVLDGLVSDTSIENKAKGILQKK